MCWGAKCMQNLRNVFGKCLHGAFRGIIFSGNMSSTKKSPADIIRFYSWRNLLNLTNWGLGPRNTSVKLNPGVQLRLTTGRLAAQPH